MVNLLIEAGACVNATDSLGIQPIHRAAECKNGGHEVLRSLVKAGASVHTLAEGWLPIHFGTSSNIQFFEIMAYVVFQPLLEPLLRKQCVC